MALFAASAALVLSQSAAMARTPSHAHRHVQKTTAHPVDQPGVDQALVDQPVVHQGEAAPNWIGENGKASYYSSRYNGRITSV